MNGFVDKIIELLRTTSLTEVYSPFLIEETQNIAAVQLRPGSSSKKSLGNTILYRNVEFAILVRGDESDSNSLGLAEEAYIKLSTELNDSFTGGKIIFIDLDPPMLVDRDKNKNIIYNLNGVAEIQIN